ncbi:MAG: hypothetical protein ISQ53_09110 [Synechococcus sp. BS307-5m-G39]|nr:hypothetical protein [Synechococcus sp. BS307-5m-G39]
MTFSLTVDATVCFTRPERESHRSDRRVLLRECISLIPDWMYTDWTAVALLLFTSVPLLAVVATATFFIWQQRKKQLR